MEAIVYTSNTGYTERYAKMLSKNLSIPCVELKEAKVRVKGKEVVYMGWFMAGVIKGLKKAESAFNIKAVCGVGMGSETEKLINDAISQNNIAVPFFYLQGVLNLKKLKGIYKFMINTLSKTMVKKYENNTKKTHEEELMLEMFINGKDMVKEENLKPIIQWLKK